MLGVFRYDCNDRVSRFTSVFVGLSRDGDDVVAVNLVRLDFLVDVRGRRCFDH